VVCSAIELNSRALVAVKRITNVFDDIPEAVRTLRELKFLRLLKAHENIISIRDVLLPSDARSFNDVFVVLELMPTDLTRVLRSKIDLSNEHIRWLAYQLLRGVHYIHLANVFHRDLKPSNILINAMCDLRICDFGLARAARAGANDNDAVFWTDYVATRWYRAPELIMTHYTHYTTAIDMWSLGCILAEMFNNGRPLFPGVNAIDQLEKIVDVTGTPTQDGLHAVRNPKARDHLLSLPKRPRRPLAEVLARNDDPQALDLLERILQFDPAARPSAAEALAHPYFASLHDPDVLASTADAAGELVPMSEFDFENRRVSIDDIRLLFLDEILRYHPSKRDTYVNPSAGPSLRFDQAGRFGDAMRARVDGRAAPPPYASMPTQHMDALCDDVAANYAARHGGPACGAIIAPSSLTAGTASTRADDDGGDSIDDDAPQAAYVTAAPAATSSTDPMADAAAAASSGGGDADELMSAAAAHALGSETAEMSGVEEAPDLAVAAAPSSSSLAASALVAPF
jgi:serine/threonine protein kinase